MKFNWKVAAAAVVIVGVLVWALSSMRSNTYSGSNLSFGIGTGTVTVTNPSDEPIAVQLIGEGSRAFTVASNIDGVAGNSTRSGAGTGAAQTFLFDLPAGTSEITVDRGANVVFSAATPTTLEATVSPLSGGAAQTTLAVSAVLILAALYFASSVTGHAWLSMLRGKPAAVPVVATADEGHGRATRSYGDNLSD